MNQSSFNFSITNAIKNSWNIFKTNPWFYVVPSLVLVALNLLTKGYESNLVIIILILFCVMIWNYVWLSISLDGVDYKNDKLNLNSLRLHFPTIKQLLSLIAIGIILSAILFVCFLPVTISGIFFLKSSVGGYGYFEIPGYMIFELLFSFVVSVYFMVRFSLANLSYVDRKEGIRKSIKHSWLMIKGDIFWTVLLTMLTYIVIMMLGNVLFGLGLIVAYPLGMLLNAQLYRAVNKHYMDSQSLAQQPIEISQHNS